MKRHLALFIFAALPALAQRGSSFQADVRGSGNSGKCTIEVNVDGVVEIEISGNRGFMRTISGQPGRWVRFQCNAPFPTGGMNDFRFRGIDGRGRQTLLRDPRENRGVAVVGIEDRQGGSEGYTFDLEWRDGYFGGNRGGGFGGGIGGGGDRPGGFGGGRRDEARAIRICQEAVRDRVDRQYGVRDPQIERIAMDNNPGRNDWVVGVVRGRGRDRYEFACSVDFNNGSVRSVDLRRR